ncbi:FHA domain-containing protein [Nocardia brasiliensis]|uniref:FHA domain-containing protein n=1 Tax=Nocardia brasiliensis TaxID=37326 RepID=UPI0024557E8A|nr:FHA domain-containing protein [Nocardia brasiliensis]
MDRQVEVVVGSHAVARVAGALVVVGHRGPGRPTPDSPAALAAESLAELIREATEQDRIAPGALIARQATRWLMKSAEQISPGEPIDFGILSPAEAGGVAIFLHGAVTAVLVGDGTVERHRGSDAAFTVDRVASAPARAAALFVDDAKGRIPEVPAERGIGWLVEGLAQAGGAIVWTDGARAASRPGAAARAARRRREDEAPLPTARIDHEPPQRPATPQRLGSAPPDDASPRQRAGSPSQRDAERPQQAAASPQPGLATPQHSVSTPQHSVSTPQPDVAVPQSDASSLQRDASAPQSDVSAAQRDVPSPQRATESHTAAQSPAADTDLQHAVTQMRGTTPTPPPDPDLQRRLEATAKATALTVKVMGFKCARAHPSDPRSAFCTVCGMPVDQTQALIEVVRPPLGMLVLDDGMTYTLAADAVLGRDPEHSDAAQRGLVPLRVDDSSGGMSRAHAEIHLLNWDVTVVDRGSTNGTRTRLPGYRDWIRLAPNQSMVLVAGAEVMLGNRVLRFEHLAPPPFGR